MPFPALIGIAASIASEFAPGLIRKLAGDDAGDVAEKVVGIAQQVTGQADPQQALDSLRADPALVLEFKSRAATLEVELEKAYLADRQDARNRDVEMRKLGYRNSRADAMIVVAGLAIVVIIWQINANDAIPPEVLAIYNMAVGALLKMLGDAFHFEFGSSRGSKEKDLRRSGG